MNKVYPLILLFTVFSCTEFSESNFESIELVEDSLIIIDFDDTIESVQEFVEIDSVNSDRVTLIKKNFKKLNDKNYWSDFRIVSIEGESTEGGEAKFFYRNNEVEKLVVKIYGEMGQTLTEYYLMNNNLSFIYHQDYKYNTHVFQDDFDFDKSDMIDFRYYFEADTIFRILSSEGGEVLYNPPYFKEVTEQKVDDFLHYIALDSKNE
jgi:hypothetical protein